MAKEKERWYKGLRKRSLERKMEERVHVEGLYTIKSQLLYFTLLLWNLHKCRKKKWTFKSASLTLWVSEE